jgi:uncharacterized protein
MSEAVEKAVSPILRSGVAVALAAEHQVAAVILKRRPPVSPRSRNATSFICRPSGLVTDRFDSLSRISKVKAPILVLHGERDRVVPVRYGRALFG